MTETYREEDISFPTSDGHKIYAVLTHTTQPQPKGLIIYAHGLPSWINDYTYLNSSRLLAKKGYDCLRFSFYDWQKGARCLTDCAIGTHVADLETVIKRFRRRYAKLYLIGHSWGGLTIMHSACKGVAAVSLWDPSYAPPLWWKGMTRKAGGLILMKGGNEFVISPKMLEQAMRLDLTACDRLSAQFGKPLQVLHAGKDALLSKIGESYHTHAAGPTDYHLIPEADHSFLAETAQKKAVALTARWFGKF